MLYPQIKIKMNYKPTAIIKDHLQGSSLLSNLMNKEHNILQKSQTKDLQ